MGRRAPVFAVRLAIVALAGVVARAAYLYLIARETKGYGDWTFFHTQANLIADGLGFIDPFALAEGHTVASASHPPLYPFLLSGLSALGADSTLWHRSAGLVLGGITIVLVGLLGRRVGGDRVGLLAACIAALYPTLIAADGALLSETLYGPLVATVLLLAYRLLDRPRLGWALALGAAIGLATLTRSEALLLLPLLALPLAWRCAPSLRRRAALLGVVCASAIVVVSPWVARNWDAFGGPTLSTNEGGVVGGANCPATYGGADIGGWRLDCLAPRSTENELDQSEIWRSDGIAYARDHLDRLPVVVPIRLLRVWDLYQPRRQVLFAEGRQIRFVQAGIAVWWLLLPFAAWGVVTLRRRRDPLLILLAPVALVTITALLGYGIPRLRHAAEIPIVVLAAVGAPALVEAARARRARRIASVAA